MELTTWTIAPLHPHIMWKVRAYCLIGFFDGVYTHTTGISTDKFPRDELVSGKTIKTLAGKTFTLGVRA